MENGPDWQVRIGAFQFEEQDFSQCGRLSRVKMAIRGRRARESGFRPAESFEF